MKSRDQKSAPKRLFSERTCGPLAEALILRNSFFPEGAQVRSLNSGADF
jgi:hypothetical protein